MNEENIESLAQVADTPSEEAFKNIQIADQAGITPDTAKELGGTLVAQLEKDQLPKTAPKAVADRMAQSSQHAAALMKDVPKFTKAKSYLDYIGDKIKGKDISRDIFDLNYRLANGEELSADDKFKLIDLKERYQSITQETDHGRSFLESIPAEVISSGYDFGRAILDSPKTIGTATAAGAGRGALAGGLAGPAGILAGAKIGAIQGLVMGVGVAQIADTYRQSTGQVYDDLGDVIKSTDDPKITRLAENEKRSIAKGAGALMAAIGILPVGTIAKKVPWVKKIVSPRSFLKHALTAEGGRWLQLMKSIGAGATAEGVEESIQEVIQIFAKEVGTTWDGSETKLLDGLQKGFANWNMQKTKQVVKSGTLGAAAGGAFAGTAHVAGEVTGANKAPIKKPIDPNDVVVDTTATPTEPKPSTPPLLQVKGSKAIHLKVALEEASKITQGTEAHKMLPQEVDVIRQQLFEDAGIGHIYVDKEDLTAWANDDKKAEKARAIIDNQGVAAGQVNAPIRIETHKFLKLVDEHPELAGFAKYDPENPSAEQFLQLAKKAEETRQQLESEVPKRPEDAAPEERMTDAEIFTEDDYLQQPSFTEAMNTDKAIPASEVFKINAAQINARTEISEALKAQAEKENNKIIELEQEVAAINEREKIASEIEDNNDIRIVDDFLNNRIFGDLNTTQTARYTQNLPVYAIDPDTLNTRDRNRFIDDPVLKHRRVFDKKGIHINEAYQLFGASDSTNFLDILSKTPTRQEAIDNALNSRLADIEAESKSNSDFENDDLAKAYNKMTNIHRKEMKILLSKDWSAVKAGIKRIANPLPTIAQLADKARNIVGNSRVRDLNVSQWKVGEIRSHKRAVKAILNNEIELAFREKEKAALNTQLAKTTHIAISRVNSSLRWIARLDTPRVRAQLKQAGKIYENAVDSILDVYNFDPRKKGKSDPEASAKFAAKMINEGKGDFRFTEEDLQWLSTQKSVKDMTVDQVLFLTDKLKEIVKQARDKNKLLSEVAKQQEMFINDIIVEQAAENAKSHPDYDPSKALRPQGAHSLNAVQHYLIKGENLINNFQFMVQRLDRGVLNGFWSKMLYQPLDGTGLHEGPYGRSAKGKLQAIIKKRYLKAIAEYGKDFVNIGIKKIKIPEFENVPGLQDIQTKMDLLTMAMHIGNEENRSRLENFGLPIETLVAVLERELEPRDFDFVQNVWDTFSSFKSRIAALEKTTKGIDIEFTTPFSFTAHGKEYKGGYFPLKYKDENSLTAVLAENQSHFEAADPNTSSYIPTAAFSGIVRSPHTKERTGSRRQIDLDFNTLAIGLEEVMHDLTMRVPVRDVMSLLKNRGIAHSIISMTDIETYNNMVNYVAEQTNSGSAELIKLYSGTQKTLKQTIHYIQGAIAINYILFNPSSVFMSSLAIPEIVSKLGAKSGTKHVSVTALKIFNPLNWTKLPELMAWAAEVDPSINTFREELDEFNGKALSYDLPQKRYFKNLPYHLARRLQEWGAHVGFNKILGTIDGALKTVAVMAAYRQYVMGDAPGHPLHEIQKLSPTELDANAKAYASQLVSSTTMMAQGLDKASIQKNLTGQIFTKFWNEPRNALNNRIQDVRNIRYSAEEMVKQAKEGNFAEANAAMQDAGDRQLRMITMSSLSLVIISLIYGKNPFGEQDESEEFDPLAAGGKFATNVADEMFLSRIPVIRDVLYAFQTNKPMTNPLMAAGTAVKDTAIAGTNYYTNVKDGMTLLEAAQNMTPEELKGVLNTTGLAARGIPASAINKFLRSMEDQEDGLNPLALGIGLIGEAVKALNSFIGKNDEKSMTAEEKFAEAERRESGKVSQLQQAVDQAKEIRDQLQPNHNVKVHDDIYQVIKFAESAGNPRSYNERSGAYGPYQFVERTWRNVMLKAPQLGLTEDDRYKPKKQEAAIRWLTEDNVKRMRSRGIKISLETIYAAHHFSPAIVDKAYGPGKTDNDRISFPSEVLNDNPVLRNVKTIGQFRKYLRGALDRGRKIFERARGYQVTSID